VPSGDAGTGVSSICATRAVGPLATRRRFSLRRAGVAVAGDSERAQGAVSSCRSSDSRVTELPSWICAGAGGGDGQDDWRGRPTPGRVNQITNWPAWSGRMNADLGPVPDGARREGTAPCRR